MTHQTKVRFNSILKRGTGEEGPILPYVRVLFKAAGAKRASWWWALQAGPRSFVRVDGEGCTRDPEEWLIGTPEKVVPAGVSLHYGTIEVLEEQSS